MISAHVKSKLKQQMKDLVTANYYKKYLQNFKYNLKRVCIFHLILVGILILSVKNGDGVGGGGGGLLNAKNLLSMAKVICQHSLSYIFTHVVKKGNFPVF